VLALTSCWRDLLTTERSEAGLEQERKRIAGRAAKRVRRLHGGLDG
jgi:hypothetical protein